MTGRLVTTMRDALRLISGGNLTAATDTIRNKLRQLSGSDEAPTTMRDENLGDLRRSGEFESYHARKRPRGVGGTFTEASYKSSAGRRRYKVFVPDTNGTSPLPLIVMLHGCKQTPDDFALGTGMNQLAADRQCVVAYPEQAFSANGSKCWNWFKSSDQQRDHGEPAIIAGITREVIRSYGLDEKRVYVAGLSAGGAMAVVMGRTYPDLYAAVGVHSGIPYASAHDVPSAFSAMKGAVPRPKQGASTLPQLIPTIVLHGDRDKTVHPSNGKRLAEQFTVEAEPTTMEPAAEVEQTVNDAGPGSRPYTRTLLRDQTGKVVVEYWLVHGAGHAWFGGNPEGSHTDPQGPDASKEIVRFFSEHQLKSPPS
jgi:poly(hydroxyalkanoate) depolymerase family esterase